MQIIFATLPNLGQFNLMFSIANKLSNEIKNEEIYFATCDSKKEILQFNNKINFISMGKMNTMNNINPEKIYSSIKAPNMFIESEILLTQLLSKDSYEEPYKNMENFIKKDLKQKNILLIIDVLTFFGLDIAKKYNIPYIVISPMDPSTFLTSKLPWSYPMVFEPYYSTVFDIIKHKIELNFYMFYNIIFRKLGYSRIELTGGFNNPERILRDSNAIICSNIWGPIEPFDHPFNLFMVGSIIEGNPNYNDNIIDWINKNNKNVIVVSFGSIAELSPKIIENLYTAFEKIVKQYNLKILWKLKNSNIEFINNDNIKIINWIPSIKEVLNNKKIILNIHHGGANSFQEALFYGIPQIIIPFWSDCYG